MFVFQQNVFTSTFSITKKNFVSFGSDFHVISPNLTDRSDVNIE
jgi:hypothetical protein